MPPPIDAGAAFAWGPTVAVLDRSGRSRLLVPAAYAARAEELSRAEETVLVDGFGHFEPVDGRAEFRTSMGAALREFAVTEGTVVAVDHSSLPAAVLELLAGTELRDLRPVVREARWTKTPGELELLRAAVAAADAGQEALLELATPGRNELEVMGGVVTQAEKQARQPLPWAGELVSGPRTGTLRYPGGPVDRELEAGDTVLMDLSVRLRGYWADCTNTLVCAGEPSAEQLRFYRAARDAFEAAVERLSPGRRASDAHAAAGAALAGHGFKPAHYTGHQLGTSVNEEPRLVPYDHSLIEAGMVFAVEPGVYGGDLGTGARAEKVVHVSERGPEILSRFRWGMDG